MRLVAEHRHEVLDDEGVVHQRGEEYEEQEKVERSFLQKAKNLDDRHCTEVAFALLNQQPRVRFLEPPRILILLLMLLRLIDGT